MVVWMEREDDDEDDGEVGRIQEQEEEAVLQRFVSAIPDLQESISGFAWRIIQCEPRYRALFSRMLRGTVITRDLPTARELLAWVLHLSISGDNDLPFQSVVTLKGEVLHVDGWLTGGSGKDGGSQQGLLAYERELRELPQQLEQHKALIDQLNAMLSEVQRAQEGRRAEQNALDKELQKMAGRINELNKVVNNSQREYERLQTEIQLAASVEQQLASEVAGLEQEVISGQERVRAHEKSQREMSGLVEELQQEMEERAIAYRRQQDELGKARTALAVKRQEAKALHQQLSFQHAQAQDLKSQVEQQVARAKETEQRRQSLQDALTSQRDELEKARARTHTLADELRIIEGKAWRDRSANLHRGAATDEDALYHDRTGSDLPPLITREPASTRCRREPVRADARRDRH